MVLRTELRRLGASITLKLTRPSVMEAVSWRIALRHGAYYAMIMRTISVKLPDELLADLTREAKAMRVTKSWLVRKSLEKGLHEQQPARAVSCYDLARDLAGTVKGLPKDLAENPKYMDGFGQ